MIKNPQGLVDAIVSAMKKQAEEAHTTKAEVDISGGIDSAVVVALACKAFGPENVIGVYSSINSSEESRKRAALVSETFGFKMLSLDLSNVFNQIVLQVKSELMCLELPSSFIENDPTVLGSLRSCLRAPIGRFVNRAFGGGIRQGTGNRDEDELVRFYQKGGDGEVDCNWIDGLFKSEVWELAEYLGVPQEIIDAKPTPDLWGKGEEHNDEDELKAITGVNLTYTRPGKEMGTIEWASRENEKNGCITGMNAGLEELSVLGYTEEEANIIKALRKMEKATRHKALPPPQLDRSLLVHMGVVG